MKWICVSSSAGVDGGGADSNRTVKSSSKKRRKLSQASTTCENLECLARVCSWAFVKLFTCVTIRLVMPKYNEAFWSIKNEGQPAAVR